MKKFLFSMLLLALVFTLSACIGGGDKAGEETKSTEKEGGIIENIKDALTVGKKMECTTTVRQDGQVFVSKSYVQGDNFKSETEMEGGKFYTLFVDGTFYNWGGTLPQGTKLTEDCLKEIEEMTKDMTEDTVDESNYETPEEWLDDPNVDVSCKSVLSIDFSVPSDVTFVDQCEMMKNLIETSKKLQESFGDFNIPSMGQ